jgi:hypothetical protein
VVGEIARPISRGQVGHFMKYSLNLTSHIAVAPLREQILM